MDVFSKSDPLCVVSMKPFGSQNWSEIKRTECIQNNLNPQWVTKVQVHYMFEEQQEIKFDVYDLDSNSRNLDEHDFLGSASVTLGKFLAKYGQEIIILNFRTSCLSWHSCLGPFASGIPTWRKWEHDCFM